jgi:1,4-alpha-glucan branching enzyme
VRMQVEAGAAAHRERFGPWSGGFWLPECAFRPGLEDHLARAGVRAFCVDQTGMAEPLDHLEPVAVGGVVAVPLDWSTIALVWDGRGYPSDPVYRDYHAQTVNGMRAWANGGRPYDRDAAHARAREHAAHFVEQVMHRATAYRAARARPALIVCALDTELLGHWWFEGPAWFGAVLAEAERAGLGVRALDDAVAEVTAAGLPPGAERVTTWGTPRTLWTWSGPQVADLALGAREAELRVVAAGAAAGDRALRELLALQSSDWAFLGTTGTAGPYPRERAAGHRAALDRALAGEEGDGRVRSLAPHLARAAVLAT